MGVGGLGGPCPGMRVGSKAAERDESEDRGEPGITGICGELGLMKTIRVIAAFCI